LLKQFSLCKKFLRENDELFVTKADKDQVTVIMKKQTYLNRMNLTLDNDSTYKRIKKDPLNSITNKTNKMLKLWADNKIIDKPTYKGLKCTTWQPTAVLWTSKNPQGRFSTQDCGFIDRESYV